MRITQSCKFLCLIIAIILIAVPVFWFMGTQISFGTNHDVISGRSTNKTLLTNAKHSVRNKALHSTSNVTTVGLQASEGVCIPTPNQPLAKLSHVRKRLDDPRLDPDEAHKVQEVACHFSAKPNVHFPHAMQQLYRCFSYWQDYDLKEPFLLVPDNKVYNKLWEHPFVSGMVQLFEEQLEVEINHMKVYSDESIQFLMKAPNVDIQKFNRIGNYSLRHAYELHYLAKYQLELSDTSSTTCEHSKPRIAILNRMDSSRRSILNAHQLANRTEIKDLSRNNFVDVQYFEKASFREQVAFFRSVDILISPHGAQLTGVAFMNAPCSHVLEIFPKGYALPGFFGSLAVESGKDYTYLYMSENPPHGEQARTKRERNSARAQALCPSSDLMVDTIRKLAHEWRQCCNARERTEFSSINSNDTVIQSDREHSLRSKSSEFNADSEGNCIAPLAKLSHIRKRLDEPRIDPDVAWNSTKQICCDFHGTADISVKRAMQQLYRCYTYLQDYHVKEPFFMFPDTKVENKLRAHPFVSGMIEILELQMEVEFYQRSTIGKKAVDSLLNAPNIDVQAFNGVGNFSLRHTYELHHLAKTEFELTDDTSSTTTCEHSKPRIAILYREDDEENNKNNNRSTLGAQFAAEIEDLSRNNIVHTKQFENADFREQVTFFRSVDILISPHGPQLAGVAFMNAPCSHVFEIFQKDNARPGVFGSLALESGKGYTYVHMPENARGSAPDQCSSSSMMVESIRKLADEWRRCCEARGWNGD